MSCYLSISTATMAPVPAASHQTGWAGSSGSPGNIEVWLTGTASPLARQQLKERGITVIENVDTRLSFMD